ncbi:unknown [Prevotella sp. CAG:1058]|nr:unknown [Prevotella sp. CAG:1058]
MKREMKREKIIIITKKMKVASHSYGMPLSFIKAPRTEGKTFPTTKMVLLRLHLT